MHNVQPFILIFQLLINCNLLQFILQSMYMNLSMYALFPFILIT